MARHALIVGAGTGISASFARALARDGYKVAIAARRSDKLATLAAEIGAVSIPCNAVEPGEVAALFTKLDAAFSSLDVVLYNASRRARGPVAELDVEEVKQSLLVSAYGGFLVGRAAAQRMLKQGAGAIFFTGASASVKGYPLSAPFAMGKFALRGLAQSMARELQPKNIHVAHFVIDGGVASETRMAPAEAPDSLLDPDAVAETYLAVLKQPRSAWSTEIELRPWLEKF